MIASRTIKESQKDNSMEIIDLQKLSANEQNKYNMKTTKAYKACLQNCVAQSASKADILVPHGLP